MSALELGPIGLGTAPLGGLFDAVDDETAHATVERAWELGVRYFDTAPLYGSGLAERRLGAALRDHPRGDFVVSTKVGDCSSPAQPIRSSKGRPHFARFSTSARRGYVGHSRRVSSAFNSTGLTSC